MAPELTRYETIHKLGRNENTIATVYLARDKHLNRNVALKVLPQSLTLDSTEYAQFQTQVRLMANLALDAVVPVLDYGLWGANPYIVSQYMPHGALTDKLAAVPLTLEKASAWLTRLAVTLDHIHGSGIAHGDLKPNNILYTAQNRPAIADYGFVQIVRLLRPDTRTFSELADPLYCAPELFDAQSAPTLRSDLYSLATVLFEALTGTTPFTAKTHRALRRQHRKKTVPQLASLLPASPPDLQAILDIALAKDPSVRYGSFTEFAAAFSAVVAPTQAAKQVAATTPDPEPAIKRKPRKKPALVETKPDAAELDALEPIQSHASQVDAETPMIASGAALDTLEETELIPDAPEEELYLSQRLWLLIQRPSVKLLLRAGYSALLLAIGFWAGMWFIDPQSAGIADPYSTTLTDVIVDDFGHEMVLIPEGEFVMGSNLGDQDEQPVHSVFLDSYYIDKFEVTNEQYVEFLNDVGNFEEGGKPWVDDIAPWDGIEVVGEDAWRTASGFVNMPVVGVTWHGASAFCFWRGGDLPTEAQWEKAARGTTAPLYPWGNTYDPAKANVCDTNCARNWANDEIDDGFAGAAPIGSFPEGASTYGVFDMAGNVAEMVADWQDGSYYQVSEAVNPAGPVRGNFRVLRGGSFYFRIEEVRTSNRSGWLPTDRNDFIGFRCAMPAN